MYDGGVREGSRVDALDAEMAGFGKARGEKVVASNVMHLKGIGGSLGRLLTVSSRLKRRMTVAEKGVILS